ncbi:hypothetical protein FPV67DRAFT_1530001 [Lyophyllum atratum]|nr:hypothetical protein FPV67DRAFT_1530001 [Lyophyllum atratum]
MIISSSLTIGQITFILRVAIQILAYSGLAIVGVLILATAPRVSSIATHDTLNRIAGASSATTSTIKWIFNRIRRNQTDPTPPTNLILILFLSVSYAIFVSLSDIGFLGFYACSVPGPNTIDFPASINSTNNARNLVLANAVNGTDLSKVKAYRCDSSSLVHFVDDVFEYNCTAWHNGTYADQQLFNALNLTDSDALMPRELAHHGYPGEAVFDLNSFYVGPTTQRVLRPLIERGLAIQPHATGVRMVLGAPQLSPNTKVELAKTMAVEVDVGCMTLGVFAVEAAGSFSMAYEYFRTNGTATDANWRQYAGPTYLEGVLNKTVDDIRAYLLPFFNTSTLNSNGYLKSINASNLPLSSAANVNSHNLPEIGYGGPDWEAEFMGNCTEALQKQLGIPAGGNKPSGRGAGTMCSLIGMGGTRSGDGSTGHAFERMVCATATQVNMVAATVQVDASRNVTLNITHLPSDFTHIFAEYWDPQNVGNDTTKFNNFVPYERFTLSDNPASPTTHFILQGNLGLAESHLGQGTAGNAISSIGDIILAASGSFNAKRYAALTLLDDGFDYVNISPALLTKWVGQVGGSYFLGSLSYNGWAALQAAPIEVLSTGGLLGSCYKSYYALGFVPLVVSATVVMCWTFLLLFSGGWVGSGIVKAAYGGISPYNAVVCPGAPPKDTLLAWESSPSPRLQLISKGYPLTGEANGTALEYLKSAPSYP